MDTTRSGINHSSGGGLLNLLRDYVASVVSLLRTRIEILSTELEEEKEWLKHSLIFSLLAMFSVIMGVIFLSLFVVVLFWDQNRLLAIGAVTVFYAGVGTTLAIMIKHRLQRKPKLFQTTLSELKRDYEHLTAKL